MNEATKSLSRNPANHSAHRFLSDAYSRRIRHEVARSSEQLQAQLLQPININPRQPSLAVSDLNVAVGTGAAKTTFNEFHPLFERNRGKLTASVAVGSNDTFSDELVASGIWDKFSFSFGQLHSESDGFRINNGVENDLYDIFAQVAAAPHLRFQIEYIDRNSKFGDLVLKIDPSNFSTSTNFSRDEEIFRIGGIYEPANHLTTLFSWIHANQSIGSFFTFEPSATFDVTNDDRSDSIEAQVINSTNRYSIIFGGSYSFVKADRTIVNGFGSIPIVILDNDKLSSSSGYLYFSREILQNLTSTLGVAVNQIEEADFQSSRIDPKVGLEWEPSRRLRVRAAVFENLKRSQRTERTIEPSHVAGFNQLFDESNGTRSRTYGIGIESSLSGDIKLGVEFTRREQERPFVTDGVAAFSGERDDVIFSYFYMPIGSNLALSIEPELRWFDSEEPLGSAAEKARTLILPVGLSYFRESGLFMGLEATWVRQDLDEFDNAPDGSIEEEFIVVDATLGYRLPGRRGILALEARNLFSESFGFQDDNFRTSRVRQPRFVPESTFFARATFSF